MESDCCLSSLKTSPSQTFSYEQLSAGRSPAKAVGMAARHRRETSVPLEHGASSHTHSADEPVPSRLRNCSVLPVKGGLSLAGCSPERSTKQSSWKVESAFSNNIKWRLCWQADQELQLLFQRVRLASVVLASLNIPALFLGNFQNVQKTEEQALFGSFGR